MCCKLILSVMMKSKTFQEHLSQLTRLELIYRLGTEILNATVYYSHGAISSPCLQKKEKKKNYNS